MSAREAEIEGIRAAERERSQFGTSISRVDAAHKTAVGLKWTPEVENAIKTMSQLGENDPPSLIVLVSRSACERGFGVSEIGNLNSPNHV